MATKKEQISEALQKIIERTIEKFDAPESEKISDSTYEYTNSGANMRANYEFLKKIADAEDDTTVKRGQVNGHGFSNRSSSSGVSTQASYSGSLLSDFDPDLYYTKYQLYSKSDIDGMDYATKQYVDNTINEIAGDVAALKEAFLAFKSINDLMKEIDKIEDGDSPSIIEFYENTGLGACKMLISKKDGTEVWIKPYETVDSNDILTISTYGEIDIGGELKAEIVPEGSVNLYQLGFNPEYAELDNTIMLQIGVDFAKRKMVTLSLSGIETQASRVVLRDYLTIDGGSTCTITAASRKWPVFFEERGSTTSGTSISSAITIKNLTLKGSLKDNEITYETGVGGYGPIASSPRKTVSPSSNEFECGIYLRSAHNCLIDNVTFLRFRGTGLTLHTKSSGMTGATVSNCIFEESHIGLHLGTRTEYNQLNNIRINNCYYGIINRGGNNNYIMTSVNLSGYALVLASGSNDGHGNMTNGQLNHNMWSVVAYEQDSGFVFIGMQMFYGDVVIKDCAGVVFETCLFKGNRVVVDTDLKSTSTVGYNQFSTILYKPYGGGVFSKTDNTPAGLINCINQDDGTTVNWTALNTAWYSTSLKNYIYNSYTTNDGSGSTYTDAVIPSTIYNHGIPIDSMENQVSSIEFNFTQGNLSSNVKGLSLRPFDYGIYEANFSDKGLLMTSPWRFSQGIRLGRYSIHEITVKYEFISNPSQNLGMCSWSTTSTSSYNNAFLLSENTGKRLEAWIGSYKKQFQLTSDRYITAGEMIEVKYKYEPQNENTAIIYCYKDGTMVGSGQEVNIPSSDIILESFASRNSVFNGYLHSISIKSTETEIGLS
jgi:hypothetical protein